MGSFTYLIPFAFGRMQVKFPFEFLAYAFAPTEKKVPVDTFTLFIDIDRYDVHMVAVDVLVLDNHIGLVAVAEPFHIYLCDVCHLHIRESVVGMRIERDVNHRVACPDIFGHAVTEVSQQSGAVHLSVPAIEHFVGGKEFSLVRIHLLGVVGKCAVERTSDTYLCDHCCSKVWVRRMICCVMSTNSCVHFSNL